MEIASESPTARWEHIEYQVLSGSLLIKHPVGSEQSLLWPSVCRAPSGLFCPSVSRCFKHFASPRTGTVHLCFVWWIQMETLSFVAVFGRWCVKQHNRGSHKVPSDPNYSLVQWFYEFTPGWRGEQWGGGDGQQWFLEAAYYWQKCHCEHEMCICGGNQKNTG